MEVFDRKDWFWVRINYFFALIIAVLGLIFLFSVIKDEYVLAADKKGNLCSVVSNSLLHVLEMHGNRVISMY